MLSGYPNAERALAQIRGHRGFVIATLSIKRPNMLDRLMTLSFYKMTPIHI